MSEFTQASIGLRVKLTREHVRYHPSLKEGVEGVTCDSVGMWGRSIGCRFAGVKFPEVTIDVLWSDLEITDPEYVAWQLEKRRLLEEGLRLRLQRAERVVGPRGGFRALLVEYGRPDGTVAVEYVQDRDEAAKLEAILKDAKATIMQVVAK